MNYEQRFKDCQTYHHSINTRKLYFLVSKLTTPSVCVDRAEEYFWSTMAATGVVNLSPSSTSTTTSSFKHVEDVKSLTRLSFAASNVAGEKLMSLTGVQLQRRRSETEFDNRSPLIVSPKAVSDSQNSQTCLDPDASRVIDHIHILFFCQLT